MKNKTTIISDKISSSLQLNTDSTKKQCDEIAFHMTDWFAELSLLSSTFNSIESFTDKEISDNILKFLLHAPEHINKASNLLVGTNFESIFDEPEE